MFRAFCLSVCLTSGVALAQSDDPTDSPTISQISTHMGMMTVPLDSPRDLLPDGLWLQFEPFQMINDLFRSDIVLLMRHGPTDWNYLDAYDVAPTDCENQRVMSEEGKIDMRNLGILLSENGIFPSKIAVSEWCRNQQTMAALATGYRIAAPAFDADLNAETDPQLNLLLSLQGAPNVQALRERISTWDGGDGTGPLLIITHFTNIDELTQFNVFEGEILVLDPKRENRVLGYMRLNKAGADIGHFKEDGNADITR